MSIGRIFENTESLFDDDINKLKTEIDKIVRSSTFLIVGAAGSIGQAVAAEIFAHTPKSLVLVDISENNLVECIRNLRSTEINSVTDLRTYALDVNSNEFDQFMEFEGGFDYILNLSAMKHVRSEKDPFTLSRLIDTNIFNAVKLADIAISTNAKKYFCVSTDKAANPVNMMGASKKIMELFLSDKAKYLDISLARFANVAFSDGSLLHGFDQRFLKNQPFSVPDDIQRYFLSKKESGQLCLLSTLFGKNRELFIPKATNKLKLIKFKDIAQEYLSRKGFKSRAFDTENEAKQNISIIFEKKEWPCYFFKSDTTGEKPFEEFTTSAERLNEPRFSAVDTLTILPASNKFKLVEFEASINQIRTSGVNKMDFVRAFEELIPDFQHNELGRNLDEKM